MLSAGEYTSPEENEENNLTNNELCLLSVVVQYHERNSNRVQLFFLKIYLKLNGRFVSGSSNRKLIPTT